MLTALLDGAAHGRANPREAAAVVLDGVWCRLRVRGVAALLLAVALSLVGGSAAAAAAGWLGWQARAAPLPSIDQATVLAAPVLPTGQPDDVVRHTGLIRPTESAIDAIAVPLLGSPEIEASGVYLTYTRPVRNRAAAFTTASNRLHDGGWRTRIDDGRLIAERSGMRITVLHAGRDGVTEDVVVSIYPTPPREAYHLAWLGAAAGILLGWLATAAAIARSRRRPPTVRPFATVLAVAGVITAVPAGLLNITALVIADTDAYAAPPWLGYHFALARPAAALSALLLTGAWALTRNGHRRAQAAVLAPAAGAAHNNS
ncbi:hypothetical protein [Micromonospora sp. NBC_01638]|uniref:hypothetical protein n=1 Tax=Micromonospora sp. NBC_01638 TaxID=2975982 RepID=UPI00386DBE81|nr:hypothetical protein OG811_23490 [Micromonospora sp. NBC_01638]